MKLVINSDFGGFGLSYKAVMLYAKLKGIKLYSQINPINIKVWKKYNKEKELYTGNEELRYHYYTKPVTKNTKAMDKYYFSPRDIPRNDPILIQVLQKLKTKANGKYATLKIVNIPNDVKYEITEYDGNETIEEIHRSWR